MSFERAGSPVFWVAENAVEAFVVAGVHQARGFGFLGATDIAGRPVAGDVTALQGLAAQECACR